MISWGEFHWFIHTIWFPNTPWFVHTTWFIHTIWFSQSTWFVKTTTFDHTCCTSTFSQTYPKRAQHQCQQLLQAYPNWVTTGARLLLQAYLNLVIFPLRSKAGFLLYCYQRWHSWFDHRRVRNEHAISCHSAKELGRLSSKNGPKLLST
jgi:hypothetical protein